ncbi:MAG: nucleotidyltransferase family protein [Deltaproteobacteria bacterium]|nr:nucleotidyltransferase family protein [Deltaproteobacteria bacterium]MBW2049416.1 nucleotidyltransferase family protein [Deltaproteobacteria bacterium]MBW2112715.1 nucleotidyltransferase family protein [Deltaproteobacteria bacterium]MBW2352269.1 nucleotidyltransferase family protein [Deltaproteobacteria bacterium]
MILRGQRVAGIILAAGASTRMGRTKQLLPLGEKTLIERVLMEALGSQLDRVVLVLGHRAVKIRDAVSPLCHEARLKIVDNRRFREGMSTSIITGLSAVENTHDHVMILLCDMPFLCRDLIDLLIRRYLESGLLIGAVRGKERPVHPMIFSRDLYPELLDLRGDMGARATLARYRDQLCLVDPEGPYDWRDIDTPEDYARVQQKQGPC